VPRRPRGARRGLAWELIEQHHLGRNAFHAVFKSYEARVAELVKERGVAREDIKLDPGETRRLFDTPELEALIRDHVEPLRNAAHALFREDDVSDPYDSKVSRIYHELSILKEEHLSVRNFPREGAGREFARLYREVSEYYPQRLRRVRDLFARAQKRLEDLLPLFAEDTIVLRSVFLFREALWPDSPRVGLSRFLVKMFPAEDPAHGWLQIARSFLKADFHASAAECARLGVAANSKQAQARSSHAQQLRETIRELDRLAARAEAEQRALEEQEA